MTVLKVDFVGLRSDRLDETVALFRDVIGVPITRQTDDLVGFRLADGTVLELYGPANEFHAFFTTGPVVAFRVENFDVTRRSISSVTFNMPMASAGSISAVRTAPFWRSSARGTARTRQRRQAESRPVWGRQGHSFQHRRVASDHQAT
jgi:hypothetical protein